MADLSPTFARHETFHPRVGWLSKGVSAAQLSSGVFAGESAPVDLGVGKNMVRAIRYWSLATKVLEERAGTRGALRPTPLGEYLLGERGVDRYAEDATTLWLLHWSLLRDPVIAPTWWWAFNKVDLVDFDQEQLRKPEIDWILRTWGSKPADASIARDIDCLLRMYSRRPGRADPIDSPFSALGLIEPVVGAAKRWRFSAGIKDTLDPYVVLFTALVHMLDEAPDAQTLSVARLATTPGGPGRAFRLTDSAMGAALREAARDIPDVTVAAPAGLTQLTVQGDKAHLAARVLSRCYAKKVGDASIAELALVNWLTRQVGAL